MRLFLRDGGVMVTWRSWSRWGERGEIGFTQYLSAEINKMNHMFAPQCMGSWADEITTKCTSLRHKSKYIRQITAGLCDILPIHALVGVSNPSAKMSVYLCVI